ncbi:aldo/keto reductase [Parasphaerochaeta coccoides]|uniref:Aryl-alcohol dehydrogenase (NADP(+)) n=1 Tax=Parasphaerochaeta coccoides (strain ATCC BAA-1237 / DSM 17374 / SPN1) TaxID=760011 RepID=F4GIA3_PARC1|nr:aldo/keto reductase [Parasphaerochaeta coccoides]AEC01262.1 Aryl-alcohol dehydrogenase (NADP(+)) [Parasphaerochaeta coccoides DSM 17374]
MEYRYFGNTGIQISPLGFGVQTFGWNVGKKEAIRLFHKYTEWGGNYFDTADSYNEGKSEEILGDCLVESKKRNDLIIGTKVFFPTGQTPNDSGASRRHLISSVETSLRRLRTEWIDLLQIHCFDARTPAEETLRALDDLVKSGKVRYIGASNYTPSEMMRALMISQFQRMNSFVSLQTEYSLLVRSPEWELLPLCQENGVGVFAWSPLAGGWLTGKYRRDVIPENSRAGRKDRWDDATEQRGTEKAYDIIDCLLAISSELKVTPVQISLAWMLRNQDVFPLIGARTVEQLDENLKSVEVRLNKAHIQALNDVSNPGLPAPYSFIERYGRKDKRKNVL